MGRERAAPPPQQPRELPRQTAHRAVQRSSGQYGPKVEVSNGADVQTKLIAFIGRDPR